MVDKGVVSGRNVFVNGPGEGAAAAALVARALGMPSAAVLTDASTVEEQAAAWSDSGWVRVVRLEPGSEFRFHLDVVLYRKAMDLSVFPALARQHGLTVAWDANVRAEHDWHFHIAYPDGSRAIRWFEFDEGGDSYAVRTMLPLEAGDRS